MLAVFLLFVASVNLVRGQNDQSIVSICSKWRNVVTDCWTNTDDSPTSAAYATCICEDPPSATFTYATVFDDNASACADYFNTIDPTLAGGFSAFEGFCAKYYTTGSGGEASSGQISTPVITTAPSSPQPTMCQVLLDIFTSCWTNTDFPLTADNVVSCVCAPPTSMAPVEFASLFNGVARKCASLESADPPAAQVYGYFASYCSKPVEAATGNGIGFTFATQTATPTSMTSRTVPTPTSSPTQIPQLPSAGKSHRLPYSLWLVVMPVIAILML